MTMFGDPALDERVLRAIDVADKGSTSMVPLGPMNDKWLTGFAAALTAEGLTIDEIPTPRGAYELVAPPERGPADRGIEMAKEIVEESVADALALATGGRVKHVAYRGKDYDVGYAQGRKDAARIVLIAMGVEGVGTTTRNTPAERREPVDPRGETLGSLRELTEDLPDDTPIVVVIRKAHDPDYFYEAVRAENNSHVDLTVNPQVIITAPEPIDFDA